MHHVWFCEVGPRDGFQFEEVPISTHIKAEVVRGLIAAGLPRIQVTSFVHPRWVPQMADAEELLDAVHEEATDAGCVLSALALNEKGVERAISANVGVLDLSVALNASHARDNANMTVAEGLSMADRMVSRALASGMQVQLGVQTVWGYGQPDDTPLASVIEVAKRFAGAGLESFSLADSTGMASPDSIRMVLDAVGSELPDTPIVLHLHDTRGLGLANVAAALEMGIRRFDTSLGGLGGCPFIPGATGNVATEDAAYLAERLGYATGIDRAAVSVESRRVSDHLGRRLSGKMYRLDGGAAD